MRVLLVNDVALEEGWGAEAVIGRLADGLRRHGDDVEIFAGRVRHDGLRKALDLWDPFARSELARMAERFRPDVVHHHNIVRELSVSVLGIPSGTGTVITAHDLRLFGVPDRPGGFLHRAAITSKGRFDVAVARRRVHVAVGVSRTIVRRLSAAGFAKVEHVPVIGPDPIEPVLDVRQTEDVVFAGRLTRDKGAHVLLEAFSSVAPRHPNARLILLGEGPERATLEAASVVLGQRVRFAGHLPAERVQEAMASARVVVAPVMPSIRPEGAGLTPVEAGLLGRPSIVSDDPALREFVDESGGGIVFHAGSAAELAEALDRLLGDAAMAAQFGAKAHRLAIERYTAGAVVPVMQEIYRTAQDSARRRAGASGDRNA